MSVVIENGNAIMMELIVELKKMTSMLNEREMKATKKKEKADKNMVRYKALVWSCVKHAMSETTAWPKNDEEDNDGIEKEADGLKKETNGAKKESSTPSLSNLLISMMIGSLIPPVIISSGLPESRETAEDDDISVGSEEDDDSEDVDEGDEEAKEELR